MRNSDVISKKLLLSVTMSLLLIACGDNNNSTTSMGDSISQGAEKPTKNAKQYDWIGESSEGLTAVQKSGKYGFINK